MSMVGMKTINGMQYLNLQIREKVSHSFKMYGEELVQNQPDFKFKISFFISTSITFVVIVF